MSISSSRSLIFEVKRTWGELAFILGLGLRMFSEDFGILRKTSDFIGNLRVVFKNLSTPRIKISRLYLRKSWQVYVSCPLRTTPSVLQEKFPWKPNNKSFIGQQACLLKMAWYWPHPILQVYWPWLHLGPRHKCTKKKLGPYPAIVILFLVNDPLYPTQTLWKCSQCRWPATCVHWQLIAYISSSANHIAPFVSIHINTSGPILL